MSDPDVADTEACLAAGMDGYLTRPLDSGQLWRTLQRWLKPERGVPPAESAVGSPGPPLPKEPEGPFDLEPIMRRHDRDMELIRELAGIFLVDTPGGLREIERALQGGELAQVERIAHGMRVACANFGAASLADLFSEIETHGRNGQPEAALEALSRAARLYTALEIALGQLEI